MRLDVYLVKYKYCESRNKAASLIADGCVEVDGKTVLKSSYTVCENDSVTVSNGKKLYVARSAYKLLCAVTTFGLEFENKIAVDLGASTGGFCQVMLEASVRKIYAVDVGTAQLHPSIRQDLRIVSMENTDGRAISGALFTDPVDIITADLSFISLTHFLPAVYDTLKAGGEFVCLVKPQFELERENVGKSGVVRDEKLHVKAVARVTDYAFETGFDVRDVCFCGLAGEAGNKEYLVYMRKEKPSERMSHEIIKQKVRG